MSTPLILTAVAGGFCVVTAWKIAAVFETRPTRHRWVGRAAAASSPSLRDEVTPPPVTAAAELLPDPGPGPVTYKERLDLACHPR